MDDELYLNVINSPILSDISTLNIIRVIDVMEFLKAEELNDKRITKNEWIRISKNINKY